MKRKLLSLILTLATITAGTAVTASAAENTPELSQAEVLTTSGVTIGDYSCTELEDGTLSVKYKGKDNDVVIPSEIDGKKVTQLGDFAFSSCNCESIVIPDSITTFGQNVFYNSKNLKSVKLPDNITTITYGMFDSCESLTDIELPDNLTTIEKRGFIYCSSLETIKFPEGLKSIGESAFWECTSLKSADLPKGLTELGDNVFWKCEGLTTFKIPDGFTTVPSGLLNQCSNLQAIEIPNSVTKIESIALFMCPSLTDIYFTGSEDEWNNVSGKPSNNKITVHYYSRLPGEGEPKTEFRLGDINSDGKITAKDAMLIQRYAVHLIKLDDTQLKAADVNSDGKVTNKDALAILRFTIGYKIEGLS